ncbi:VOC family protein [Burkholderia sp. BCC0044]|uniref:VOC family protein n=1 Tax=Burkholderia sp. BCC0044 TaxID=2676295 RepID=UPI00158EB94D|nr:VOC family protein [Burkholderia sp. BCC0044]
MYFDMFPIFYVADLRRSLAFYTGLLEFRETYRFPEEAGAEPEYVTLELGGKRLGLWTFVAASYFQQRMLPPPAGPRGELCLYVENTEAAIEKLRNAGVKIIKEVQPQPWGKVMSVVEDPDGNPLHITTPADRPNAHARR